MPLTDEECAEVFALFDTSRLRGAVVLVRVREARVQPRRRAEAARSLRVARGAVVHDADVRVGVRVLRLRGAAALLWTSPSLTRVLLSAGGVCTSGGKSSHQPSKSCNSWSMPLTSVRCSSNLRGVNAEDARW